MCRCATSRLSVGIVVPADISPTRSTDLIIAGVAVSVVACLASVVMYCFCRRRKERISAGYEKQPKAPEFAGYVQDLEHDILNTLRLFGGRLKYDCFPKWGHSNPGKYYFFVEP